MSEKDERMFAMLIYVISFFTALIGPLVIWLLKKDESEFIDYHGREYFNFFISYIIYGVIASILILLLVGLLILPIIGVAALIFTILAAVKAYEGERYRIPFIFRFL
ncbi:DUF4870 domain-containing protein [Bacillus alkalicellulosilyticus]|uniref:DUF4870 domain-containing protein n=1 Tax=Alkalihalobacterium alkalicellulosilyticum TaxID=1912214 RepID=UPI00099740FB|nr:DUF4870 domain-containing protein [Bacillus alkalicellulosilyticus]